MDWVLAAVIIAEVGIDMSVFHSVRHLAAWSGVCPGNNESGGRRRRSRVRRGNPHLQTALVQAAAAAARKKGSYKRAAMAIAHKILIAAYHMLAEGADYHDLGETYLDSVQQRRTTKSLVRRLERLGYEVQLKPKAA